MRRCLNTLSPAMRLAGFTSGSSIRFGGLGLVFVFLLSCGGGGGGGGGDSSLRAELTFTPYADAVFIVLNNHTSNLGGVVDLTIRALDEDGEQVSNVTLSIEDLIQGHNYTIPAGIYLFELIATVRTDTDSVTSRKIRIDYLGVRPDADGKITFRDIGDRDGDGVENYEDVDVDGDGLVEIATAAELNGVRYALDGSGRKLSEAAELNSKGCGNGADIGACSGYELTQNISLSSYRQAEGGRGWQPIGHDRDSTELGCQGEGFSGTFDGNGFTVRDLRIARPNQDCIGLFGGVKVGVEIRRLVIEAEEIEGQNRVGTLLGDSNATMATSIISSSADSISVTGAQYVGGLVGVGGDAILINSSSVNSGVVNGTNSVGGLLGHGLTRRIRIISSSANSDSVVGTSNEVGGLVGNGYRARIISSRAYSGTVRGNDLVGGLVGDGRNARIISSRAHSGAVRGNDRVGGLVGSGERSNIVFSLAISGSVTGDDDIGGLLGEGGNSNIISALSISGLLTGSGNVIGGLVGTASTATIVSSLAVAGSLTGREDIGGVVGFAIRVKIVASSAVFNSAMGDENIGGLVGNIQRGEIAHSLAIAGSLQGGRGGGIIGEDSGSPDSQVFHSYWGNDTTGDSSITGIGGGRSDITMGSGKRASDLRLPTGYEGIYANWDDGYDIDDVSGVENITIWCDSDNDGEISTAEQTNDNRIWDFGTSEQYPAIRCVPISLEEQRSWWYINTTTNQPELNQARLDGLVN